MLRGIWGDPERYQETYWSRFPGRYFAGDGAKLDDDGYLWLLGRVDDVMNISGHRISTTEVESALVSHPERGRGRRRRRERRHHRAGHHRLRHPALGLRARPRARRGAARTTWPDEIGAIAKPRTIIFTPDLPKTRSGKIMRRLLRDVAEGQDARRHHDAGRCVRSWRRSAPGPRPLPRRNRPPPEAELPSGTPRSHQVVTAFQVPATKRTRPPGKPARPPVGSPECTRSSPPSGANGAGRWWASASSSSSRCRHWSGPSRRDARRPESMPSPPGSSPPPTSPTRAMPSGRGGLRLPELPGAADLCDAHQRHRADAAVVRRPGPVADRPPVLGRRAGPLRHPGRHLDLGLGQPPCVVPGPRRVATPPPPPDRPDPPGPGPAPARGGVPGRDQRHRPAAGRRPGGRRACASRPSTPVSTVDTIDIWADPEHRSPGLGGGDGEGKGSTFSPKRVPRPGAGSAGPGARHVRGAAGLGDERPGW